MRRADVTKDALFSYQALEERIPARHPLRRLSILVDALLKTMNAEFEAVYLRRRRPSIAPGHVLWASLMQTLFIIRSERQLVQHIEYFRSLQFDANGGHFWLAFGASVKINPL